MGHKIKYGAKIFLKINFFPYLPTHFWGVMLPETNILLILALHSKWSMNGSHTPLSVYLRVIFFGTPYTNPAGRRHKVAAPWNTALRYCTDLHCIHASAIKCSDSWAYFPRQCHILYCDFWLNYRRRLGCTYQTFAESVNSSLKSDELRGARQVTMIDLAHYNVNWAAELVAHAHRTQVFNCLFNGRTKCSSRSQELHISPNWC